MRDPGPLPWRDVAERILGMEKPTNEDRIEDILRDAQRNRFEMGSRIHDEEGGVWRWEVTIQMLPHRVHALVLNAQFKINKSPVMGLEYHDRPVRGRHGVPRGYHWDIFPPLYEPTDAEVSLARIPHAREWIDPQPDNVRSALDLVLARWNIAPVEPRQEGLRHGRR